MSADARTVATARGDTVIAPAAIARIAGRAAEEIDGVAVVQRSGLTGRARAGDNPAVGVDARPDRSSGTVALQLTLGLRWPRPVGPLADQVRAHVTRRVSELTGLRPTTVDIDVEAFDVPGRSGRVA